MLVNLGRGEGGGGWLADPEKHAQVLLPRRHKDPLPSRVMLRVCC